MITNESLTNIFPDSSNQFTNVNQPCACLSTAFLEQTGTNGTGKGQMQHKHIGIFWPDHHCVITILHVAVDEWQPPLGSYITPALPLFCLQKSFSISPHTWHTALFYFRWILLTYCSVCHSSTRNLTKLVLFFTWLRNVFCCLISCGAVMFTTYTPVTSPRMLLSVFLMEFSL